ncbi:uncharacterized, partial [Tachysurus ichikawai]
AALQTGSRVPIPQLGGRSDSNLHVGVCSSGAALKSNKG